ncbi:hypothetical protein ACSSVY_000709 [Roseovarius sp. MBR-51]
MMTLLGAHPAVRSASTGGLEPPMAALNAPPLQFTEVYGPNGLLAQTAVRAAASGDMEISNLLTALHDALENDLLGLEPSLTPGRRLIGYVYPVV